MKSYRLTLVMAILLGIIALGCRPDSVKPNANDPEIGALVDTLHTIPSPACTTVIQVPLMSSDPTFNQAFGVAKIVNDLDNVACVFDPIPGLSVAQAALWWQQGGCDPAAVPSTCNYPVDGNGNLDPTKFPRFINVNPVRSPYAIRQPLSTLYQCNTYAAWAMLVSLDVNGNVIFDEPVWVVGKPATSDGSVFDFCSGRCPEHDCDPWLDSPNSCFGGSNNTGDTITLGDCNKCDTENTVAIDCTNPSCAWVSSCKGLSNIVVMTSDGTVEKFDNIGGNTQSGVWCATNGGDIVTVWVKSGCNHSGDGPGYGRRFDLTCN